MIGIAIFVDAALSVGELRGLEEEIVYGCRQVEATLTLQVRV